VAPHLIHAGVAVVSLLIFIPLGLMDALSRMELNPTSRSWLAMNHSKTEVRVQLVAKPCQLVLIRCMLTKDRVVPFQCVADADLWPQGGSHIRLCLRHQLQVAECVPRHMCPASISQSYTLGRWLQLHASLTDPGNTFSCVALPRGTVMTCYDDKMMGSISCQPQVPYMHDWVNHARAASFTCVLFCAIVLTIVTFHPGVDWDDAQGLQDYRQKVGGERATTSVGGVVTRTRGQRLTFAWPISYQDSKLLVQLHAHLLQCRQLMCCGQEWALPYVWELCSPT
jgi:hypothetical protein